MVVATVAEAMATAEAVVVVAATEVVDTVAAEGHLAAVETRCLN